MLARIFIMHVNNSTQGIVLGQHNNVFVPTMKKRILFVVDDVKHGLEMRIIPKFLQDGTATLIPRKWAM